MIRFELLEPKDISEACSLLSKYKEKARIIAGGHGLLPLLKHRLVRPAYVISIKKIPNLSYITDSASAIKVGALTTNREIEQSPVIKKYFPMLSDIEHIVGDVQTRNWGTLVGNLCVSTPTSDPSPIMVAIGAKAIVQNANGKRSLPFDEFFTGYMKTALQPDEMVVELELPKFPARTAGSYHKENIRATDSPIASVCTVIGLDTDLKTIKTARVVLQAVCPSPMRSPSAEKVLIGAKVSEKTIADAADAASADACPISDIYGSSDYKKAMVNIIAKQVLNEAIDRAKVAA
jgi:aerobic carbon-monoxide dehydrogenase medium subunit